MAGRDVAARSFPGRPKKEGGTDHLAISLSRDTDQDARPTSEDVLGSYDFAT
jgi:hypothetical protein